MKKYIAPELNVTVFDVEDVITASNVTGEVYTTGNDGVTQTNSVDYTEIFN